MYYSYVEIEYVATSFSPARTHLALKLLTIRGSVMEANVQQEVAALIYHIVPSIRLQTRQPVGASRLQAEHIKV